TVASTGQQPSSPTLPYNLGAMAIPNADQGFVAALVSALADLRGFVDQSNQVLTAAQQGPGLKATLQASEDAGQYDQKPGSTTNADGTVTTTLTTTTADKVESQSEILSRTDKAAMGGLLGLTVSYDDQISGIPIGSREELSSKRTIAG